VFASIPNAKKEMIIGLSGKRGSGKNTVAEIIQGIAPNKWQLKAFADPLKEITAKLTGQPLAKMYTQEGKTTYLPEWGMTIGEFQQKLGTDAIREGLHQEAWVLAALSSYKKGDYYILCDMRFPNEAEAIKAKGGILIRIEGDPLMQQGDGTRNDNHPSETSLDNYTGFDTVIVNNGTMHQLVNRVYDIYLTKILKYA
jgi:energy-coupling factor transporter ATP-binding protein EcfA2